MKNKLKEKVKTKINLGFLDLIIIMDKKDNRGE